MSESNNFGSGFILGAIFGGVIGGLVGGVVASKQKQQQQDKLKAGNSDHKLSLKDGETVEDSRKHLEDKIAQLNSAIDDVRQQLDTVNANRELD